MPAPGGPAGASGPVRRRGEHGSATAELAVLMPGLVLLMTLIVGVAQVGAAHLRCQDAARAAARLAARGEPAGVVLAAARSAAPGGAVVRVGTAGGRATVRIDTRVPVAGLSGLTVSATAVAALEQP